MTPSPAEKVLLIESNPDHVDLIARQTLTPMGFQVVVAADGASAIKHAIQFQPDLILADLKLPGLTGKDLLVAFKSQGIDTPVVVMTDKGDEANVIQAFRLGASDYLVRPVRDTEVVACVERAMTQVRERRSRAQLDEQVKHTNAELQRKVRELTTIFAVGRAVLSVTDQRVLFEKITEAVTSVSEADMGWLTLRDETSKAFVLVAHRNLPEAWGAKKLGQPLDDGLSSLVAMSAESFSIAGDPLAKFKISMLGKSAMVVPIKVQNEAIGLMTVVRKQPRPFGLSEQTLLEAIADYASISLVNTRLFRALSHTAEAAQAGEKRKYEMLLAMKQEIQGALQPSYYALDAMHSGKMGAVNEEQKQAIQMTLAAIKRVLMAANQQATQPQQKITG